MSVGGGQLQELSEQLQIVQSQIEALQTTVETLRAQQTAIDEAIEAIETLDTDDVVQVPLGGGAYVRATIEDIDEIIVEIGGDYAAEFDQENAAGALDRKKDRIDERIEEATERIGELQAEGAELEQEAQALQQQAMQQQLQQQQGLGRDE